VEFSTNNQLHITGVYIMKMTKALLPADMNDTLKDELVKTYDSVGYNTNDPAFRTTAVEGTKGMVVVARETAENKLLRNEVMKTCIRPALDALKKGVVNVASGFTPYDLRAPSFHLVPWLSPIRESLPRVSRAAPGGIYHWKSVIASSNSYSRGGLPAMPWVNEGQRAPQISMATIPVQATYTTMGREGSVTFEAESSSIGYEDAVSSNHYFTLESVMVLEEDSLLGGNNSLALGKANTPTGVGSGSGSLTGYYAGVVGLTYEGYRNFVQVNGLSS